MGVVNVTHDSFSDGGCHSDPGVAIEHARRLLQEGADILDVGGESTRPGAQPISPAQEWARIDPVLRELARWGVPVSVDTRHTETMGRALELDVDIINDVQALQAPGAVALLASHGRAGVCLMHMRGEPRTMQDNPDCDDDPVIAVTQWLSERAALVRSAGVAAQRILVDPGIGFGKTPQANLQLLARQDELLGAGHPLVVGWSRKSTLGLITGRPVSQRLGASVAAAVLAAQAGASVLRVHDVAPTVDALRVWRQARMLQAVPTERQSPN